MTKLVEDNQDNKSFDLGYLTLFDSNPLFNTPQPPADIDQHIKTKSVNNISFFLLKLMNQLAQVKDKRDRLPEEFQQHDFTKSQLNLTLPQCETIFPRARKLPTKRPQTKWEKFAKEKGIKNKKRGGMVFDEETKKYLPRWGAKSKKNFQPAIMEEKTAGVDPFKQRQNTRKLKISKQNLREHKNRSR